MHAISCGDSFYGGTWIDSFIGFELAYADGELERIDGSVIHGDSQQDASFEVRRNHSGGYQIEYTDRKRKCRPFMFRYLTDEESNKASISTADTP